MVPAHQAMHTFGKPRYRFEDVIAMFGRPVAPPEAPHKTRSVSTAPSATAQDARNTLNVSLHQDLGQGGFEERQKYF